ncbi:hypothetical protein, partial [Synechococcus sp. R55.7]|uniref:hypothetical protein n=1 Tax=Synechococcus sp. R55.7 TaxID=2964500 RepID=UPI0039C4C8BF
MQWALNIHEKAGKAWTATLQPFRRLTTTTPLPFGAERSGLRKCAADMESCTDRRSGEGLYSSLKPNKSKNFRARLRDTNGKKSFFHVVRIAAKQRP